MSTNTEKLRILGKSRLTVRDIRTLCDVGTDRAAAMAKEFKEWFKKEYPTAANLGIPSKRKMRMLQHPRNSGFGFLPLPILSEERKK